MSARVYVNRTGQNVWSPNTKEQLCEAFERLWTDLATAREQRDALASGVDAPCGDQRCYCGGCVL